jgi:hypothetical protein
MPKGRRDQVVPTEVELIAKLTAFIVPIEAAPPRMAPTTAMGSRERKAVAASVIIGHPWPLQSLQGPQRQTQANLSRTRQAISKKLI